MKTYKVYWKDILIGTLEVNNKQHRYIPNFEGIKKLEGVAPLVAQTTRPYDWGEEIPFFSSRISNCERFGDEDYTSHTDNYRLEPEVKEKKLDVNER